MSACTINDCHSPAGANGHFCLQHLLILAEAAGEDYLDGLLALLDDSRASLAAQFRGLNEAKERAAQFTREQPELAAKIRPAPPLVPEQQASLFSPAPQEHRV